MAGWVERIKNLDLPDSGCWTSPAPETQLGDVCAPVLLPLIEAPDAYKDPGPPPVYWLEAAPNYVLVLKAFRGYAVVAPVALPAVTEKPESFGQMVESGRSAPLWVRLPKLPCAWDDAAVAVLFKPQTVLTSALDRARVASMGVSARQVLTRRVAVAFTP